MYMRINDKPIVTFSCLSVCEKNGIVIDDKGSSVTFRAIMPDDKNKTLYTFNAFDDVRERIIKLNLKKGSRITVIAVLKNYVDSKNVSHYSFTVCLIDYLPADGKSKEDNEDNTQSQQSQTKPQKPVTAAENYQRYQQPESQLPIRAASQRKYSSELPEVDIDEFANALGNMYS